MSVFERPEVVVAIVGLLGVLVTQLVQYRLSRRSELKLDEVNDAVNHRHEKHGDGAPKLYDAVMSLFQHVDSIDQKQDTLLEWKRGYDGTVFSNTDAINSYIKLQDKRYDAINKKLIVIQQHVDDTGCPYRLKNGSQPPDVNCGRGLPEDDK